MSIKTEREFMTKVLALNIEGADGEDIKEYARQAITKLDERNAKRKNTPTKAQKENAETMKKILELVSEKGAAVASEIGALLNTSTQKASALCKLLVDNKVFGVRDLKIKGKGSVKQYFVIESDNEIDDLEGADDTEE